MLTEKKIEYYCYVIGTWFEISVIYFCLQWYEAIGAVGVSEGVMVGAVGVSEGVMVVVHSSFLSEEKI